MDDWQPVGGNAKTDDWQPVGSSEKKSERSLFNKLTGADGGERYQTLPERVVRGIGNSIVSGATFPGDVYAGRDAPDNWGRALDVATMYSPLSAGRAAGRIVNQQSPAVTATELGAPLPKGLASENAGVQAITQAARQLPFVGQKIEERTAKTIGSAGEAVENVAAGMGAADRYTVGGNLRGSIADAIDTNKGSIDSSYAAVRSLINPKETFIPEKTKQVLETIKGRRAEAGQPKPEAGLEQIENITTNGVNFDGLIRAKSDLAHSVNFLDAHAGFSNADKKQIGAAMSHDLGQIVAASAAKNGANPASAMASLRQAEGEAARLIEGNRTLSKLNANSRDEGIAGIVMNAASAKNGNLKLLAQLKSQIPQKDFEQIGGSILSELGQNPATGSFSLNKFATNWEKMSPQARATLFPSQHAKFLDDVAKLGQYLKNSDQYINSSGSGRAVTLSGMISAGGTAAVAAAMGHYAPILGLSASIAGGYLLAKSLASPAVSASMARMSRAAIAYDKAPSVASRTSLMLAGRNAANNIASYNNVSVPEFLKMLQGPAKSAAEPDQQEIPGYPSQ